MSKHANNAFQTSIEKRRQKTRRRHQWRVDCGGLYAASRNAKFLLRKIFANISWWGVQTPPLPAECGGLLLRSLTRGPPHCTKLLALVYVKKVDQNLGGFCQDLDRTLAISARILLHKVKPRSVNTKPINYQKS